MENKIVTLSLYHYSDRTNGWAYVTLNSSLLGSARATLHISAIRGSRPGVLHLAYSSFYRVEQGKGHVREDTRT